MLFVCGAGCETKRHPVPAGFAQIYFGREATIYGRCRTLAGRMGGGPGATFRKPGFPESRIALKPLFFPANRNFLL